MIKFSATLGNADCGKRSGSDGGSPYSETTDLHSNMMDFDYYKDTPTENSDWYARQV